MADDLSQYEVKPGAQTDDLSKYEVKSTDTPHQPITWPAFKADPLGTAEAAVNQTLGNPMGALKHYVDTNPNANPLLRGLSNANEGLKSFGMDKAATFLTQGLSTALMAGGGAGAPPDPVEALRNLSPLAPITGVETLTFGPDAHVIPPSQPVTGVVPKPMALARIPGHDYSPVDLGKQAPGGPTMTPRPFEMPASPLAMSKVPEQVPVLKTEPMHGSASMSLKEWRALSDAEKSKWLRTH